MRSLSIPRWILVGSVLAIAGCSKAPATAPATPAAGPSEFVFDVRFTYADSGYVVRDVEYADASGVVHKVDFHPPVWRTTLKLEPGDRLYLHAEVEYRSGLAGIVQISAPGFYRSDRVESLDGPAIAVIQIDEPVK